MSFFISEGEPLGIFVDNEVSVSETVSNNLTLREPKTIGTYNYEPLLVKTRNEHLHLC